MSIRIHVVKKIEYGDELGILSNWTLGNLDALVDYERLNCDGCGDFDVLRQDVKELLKSKKLTNEERAICDDLLKRMGDEDYLLVSCW